VSIFWPGRRNSTNSLELSASAPTEITVLAVAQAVFGVAASMAGNELQIINFDAPSCLRKWPSLNGKRVTETHYPGTYLLVDGTLDECIQQFMTKPASQRHLYEIHTTPQEPLVSAILSAEHIVQLARLREFLAP
jgi:hypothetical protein